MLVRGLMVGIVVLDQLTKHVVWFNFDLGQARQVIPRLFDIRYVRNTGAAWGMFAGHRWPLIAVSVVMLVLLRMHRRELYALGLRGRVALGLLLGGIIGNLIDRVRFGYVVDFLDFHIGQSHFPAFNVADAAICCGVFVYMVSIFLAGRSKVDAGDR